MEKFEILLYTAPEGNANIEVFFENETFWLSQKKMADLFNVDVRTINEHLKNIYNTGELTQGSTIRKFRIVQKEGVIPPCSPTSLVMYIKKSMQALKPIVVLRLSKQQNEYGFIPGIQAIKSSLKILTC